MRKFNLSKAMAVLMTTAMTVVGVCPVYAAASQTSTSDEAYKYVYAGLSWAEYWENEGVYLSGSDLNASSEEVDTKGEHDKGAFDAVTRATTNHGLHRGSYQCDAVIHDTEGGTYEVAYWTGKNDAVLSDGKKITFANGVITKEDGSTATMDYYEVTGIKYVPVKISTADYDDFCAKYDVVENESALAGGYTEGNLTAYGINEETAKTAQITEYTNGLKEAVKKEDGTYSFKTRVKGTDSGVKEENQKKVSDDTIVVTVREGDGAYGEFLRVDLTGDGYGDLGSNMQAVRWDYYGTETNQEKPLVSFGTKFAADNWMHKAMGIQLGLTESLRCQLPEGTDGTGRWVLTVYAMGYEDYSFSIDVTAANIVNASAATEETIAELEKSIQKAETLNQADYTESSWSDLQTELEEAKEELTALHSEAAVKEALNHLEAAIRALVKKDSANNENNNVNPGTNGGANTNNPVKETEGKIVALNKVKGLSVKNLKTRKVLVRWKKVNGAEGYVIYRSTKKKGVYKAVKTVKSAKTVKYVNKKLKKGKTYFYKVRAYKTVNGEKVYGTYCAAKKVKIKK